MCKKIFDDTASHRIEKNGLKKTSPLSITEIHNYGQ